MKLRQGGLCMLIVVLLAGIGNLAGLRAAAQSGPDAWTAYQLNLRAGPGGSYAVVTVLPSNTGLIVEGHNADLSWLLVHTEDSAWRGWVASGYLSYADGFSATRLPLSEEIVTAGPAPAPDSAPQAPPAGTNGAVESMTLIYSNDRSEYYRLTYWSDGLRINAFLGFPKSEGKHPAIIYNRGGVWNTGALIGVEIIPLVECGYVAAASQYRGNGGSEGAETFGSGDVNDVRNLIPLLQALPNVDPAKIGMMGGSRGGMVTYMALKAETLSGTRRIRAAVTVGGIADLFMWAAQRPELIDAIFVPLIGARPSENRAEYVARSAVYWPGLISAPLLLEHGDADTEVSVEESRKLYAAMVRAGRTAKLIVYPGDDHPLTGQLGGYRAAVDWFGHYFGLTTTYDGNWDAINSTTQWFYQHRP
jgi:dienelactone hydrolase